MQQMNAPCPLSRDPATFTASGDPQTKHFKCPKCVEFLLDSAAEDHLKTMGQASRATLSDQAANAPAERILILREPTPDERRAQVPPTEMVREYVTRPR